MNFNTKRSNLKSSSGLIFIVMGLIFTLFLGQSLIRSISLSQGGIRVPGTVVQNMENYDSEDSSITYCPIVSFTTHTNETVITRGSDSYTNPPMFDIGEEVEISYDENNPQLAIINSFGNVYLSMLFLLIPIIFIIVGVYIFIKGKKRNEDDNFDEYNSTYNEVDSSNSATTSNYGYSTVTTKPLSKGILYVFAIAFTCATVFLGLSLVPTIRNIPINGLIPSLLSNFMIIFIFVIFALATFQIYYLAFFAKNTTKLLTVERIMKGRSIDGKTKLNIIFSDDNGKKYDYITMALENEEDKYFEGQQYTAQCLGRSISKLL